MQFPLPCLILLWVLTAPSPLWKETKTKQNKKQEERLHGSVRWVFGIGQCGLPSPAWPRVPSLWVHSHAHRARTLPEKKECKAQGPGKMESDQCSSWPFDFFLPHLVYFQFSAAESGLSPSCCVARGPEWPNQVICGRGLLRLWRPLKYRWAKQLDLLWRVSPGSEVRKWLVTLVLPWVTQSGETACGCDTHHSLTLSLPTHSPVPACRTGPSPDPPPWKMLWDWARTTKPHVSGSAFGCGGLTHRLPCNFTGTPVLPKCTMSQVAPCLLSLCTVTVGCGCRRGGGPGL